MLLVITFGRLWSYFNKAVIYKSACVQQRELFICGKLDSYVAMAHENL